MTHKHLDREQVRMRSLIERENRINIDHDQVTTEDQPVTLSPELEAIFEHTVMRIQTAVTQGRPVVAAFGAHTIKNGLGPVLIALMEQGWLTHLATNGAGIIHDWEFSYQGKTSEQVATNVADGSFGNWEETGRTINLALLVGAYEGKGYGESVGAMIENEGLSLPSVDELRATISELGDDLDRVAAAADLLERMQRFAIEPGFLSIPHPWKRFSVQAAAYRLGIPFTGHPMIGHDIIYNHPLNHGGAVGRTALRDFLAFAETIRRIDNGVYLSIGSAVMSPMIFEKSFSMAQNLAQQEGRRITNHTIIVIDLAPATWNWTCGEPPEHNPAYYLRYMKSFSRMGGTIQYMQIDNRDFLLQLWQRLEGKGDKNPISPTAKH